MTTRLARVALVAVAIVVATTPAAAGEQTRAGPAPGTPEYVARDLANMQAAYQQQRPDEDGGGVGDPYRAGTWNGIRGQSRSVAFRDSGTGGTFAGRVHAPRAGATHPETGRPLKPPFPGVVIVSGTNQDAANYAWAAEDLAERGYVTLTFGVPGQQGAPRYYQAARDAIDFFWSTSSAPVRGPGLRYNPYWDLFDRTPQATPSTPGRPYRFAIMGHSVGALVSSALANIDPRVSALVAWDKIVKSSAYSIGGEAVFDPGEWRPTVPALAVHSEYFLGPTPYILGCALPNGCDVYLPTEGPPPDREISMGYGGDDSWGLVGRQPGGWAAAGVDVMHLVLRSSTHNEYVDDAEAKSSRYGKAVTSYYQTAWLDRYLGQVPDADDRLAATSFRQLEPRKGGVWAPTPLLQRDEQLSFYFCSAWRYHSLSGALVDEMDPTRAGCNRVARPSQATNGMEDGHLAGAPVVTGDSARHGSDQALGRGLTAGAAASRHPSGRADGTGEISEHLVPVHPDAGIPIREDRRDRRTYRTWLLGLALSGAGAAAAWALLRKAGTA